MQKWEAANGHNNSGGQILIAFIFLITMKLLPNGDLPAGDGQIKIKVDLRLVAEEAICTQCRQQIHQKIMDAAMAGMDS